MRLTKISLILPRASQQEKAYGFKKINSNIKWKLTYKP
jgi:hypothetical protein